MAKIYPYINKCFEAKMFTPTMKCQKKVALTFVSLTPKLAKFFEEQEEVLTGTVDESREVVQAFLKKNITARMKEEIKKMSDEEKKETAKKKLEKERKKKFDEHHTAPKSKKRKRSNDEDDDNVDVEGDDDVDIEGDDDDVLQDPVDEEEEKKEKKEEKKEIKRNVSPPASPHIPKVIPSFDKESTTTTVAVTPATPIAPPAYKNWLTEASKTGSLTVTFKDDSKCHQIAEIQYDEETKKYQIVLLPLPKSTSS